MPFFYYITSCLSCLDVKCMTWGSDNGMHHDTSANEHEISGCNPGLCSNRIQPDRGLRPIVEDTMMLLSFCPLYAPLRIIEGHTHHENPPGN